MKVSYPKHPREIQIRITHQDITDGLLSPIKTLAQVPLSEKLNDYIFRLGYSNTHMMGIIIHLMTTSKIQVDFAEYTERLELVDPADGISSPQAIGLLEDYIAEVSQQDETPKRGGTTQRIVVQAPRSLKSK